MVLVRPGRYVSEALKILEDSRVSPVWSELSQTVYLSDFVGSTRVSLPQALKRVQPGDPRRTPWLDGLIGFYRAGEGEDAWSILYLPASQLPRAVRAFTRSLPGEAWRPADSILPRRPGLLWIPGAVLAAVLALRSRRGRLGTLAAALPWIPLGVSGRITAALAGIWGYQGILDRADRNGLNPAPNKVSDLKGRLPLGLPQALTLTVLAAADPPSIPCLVLSLASAACLVLGSERLKEWKAARRVHDVFRGVILDVERAERESEALRRRRVLAALVASTAVLVFHAFLPAFPARPSGTDPALPPLPRPGSANSPRIRDARTVERIVRERAGQGLPTLADAVAHRAYQQALPYSRIGTREYGSLASVVLDKLDPQGDRVNLVRETVVAFDDGWVRNALQEEAGTGIGAVLAGQKGVVEPSIGAPEGGLLYGSLALRDVFFYIILLAPAVLSTVWKGIPLPNLPGRGFRTDSRR